MPDVAPNGTIVPTRSTMMLMQRVFHAQQLKFGEHPLSVHLPQTSPLRKLRVLVEEVGEVARELDVDKPVDVEHLRLELAQTASVCLAWLDSLNGVMEVDV